MRKNIKIVIVGLILIISILIIAGYNINTLNESISLMMKETQSLEEQNNETRQVLEILNNQFNITQNGIIQKSKSLNDTINELQLRQSEAKYTLHDPLYQEAWNFLMTDPTNTKPYNKITFNCENYAQEVINNAEKRGIRCTYVTVNFSDSEEGHALIAFNTTDQGLKFFEPQSDERVNLLIGENYWGACVIPNGNYYYLPEPGCTVKAYTICG